MKQKLIGRKVKGFKFETNAPVYQSDMDNYIGEVGVIEEYVEENISFKVRFKDNYWHYPASLIEQHLVDETVVENAINTFCETKNDNCRLSYCDVNGCQERQRNLVEPESSDPLDNLPIIGEGVLMEVSDDNVDWVQKYVFAKYGRYFLAVKDIDKPLIVQEFNFCRPIVKTKITRAEFESKFEIID
jgi:hypothetical protein